MYTKREVSIRIVILIPKYSIKLCIGKTLYINE